MTSVYSGDLHEPGSCVAAWPCGHGPQRLLGPRPPFWPRIASGVEDWSLRGIKLQASSGGPCLLPLPRAGSRRLSRQLGGKLCPAYQLARGSVSKHTHTLPTRRSCRVAAGWCGRSCLRETDCFCHSRPPRHPPWLSSPLPPPRPTGPTLLPPGRLSFSTTEGQ